MGLGSEVEVVAWLGVRGCGLGGRGHGKVIGVMVGSEIRGRGLGVRIWGWGHSRVRGVMEGSEVGDRVWSQIQNSEVRGHSRVKGQGLEGHGRVRGQRSRTEARVWGSGCEVRGQRKGS